MFCLSLDKIDDDFELSIVCHRPEGLDKLEAQTNFSKQELQVLYRGFKNVCSHSVCHSISPLLSQLVSVTLSMADLSLFSLFSLSFSASLSIVGVP